MLLRMRSHMSCSLRVRSNRPFTIGFNRSLRFKEMFTSTMSYCPKIGAARVSDMGRYMTRRRLRRAVFGGFLCAVVIGAAGCSSEISRFGESPNNNPYAARASSRQPAAAPIAPTRSAAVESQPLPQAQSANSPYAPQYAALQYEQPRYVPPAPQFVPPQPVPAYAPPAPQYVPPQSVPAYAPPAPQYVPPQSVPAYAPPRSA